MAPATNRPPGGLEWDRLGALFIAFLRAEFFTVGRGGGAGSSLAASALFQAGFCILGGSILFLGLPLFHFTIAGLTLVAVMTALVLGPEAGRVLQPNGDRLAGWPVTKSTVRAARLLHAVTYLILGTAGGALPIAAFAAIAGGSAVVGICVFGAALAQTFFFAALTSGVDTLLAGSRWFSPFRPLFAFGLGGLLVAVVILGVRPLPDLSRMLSDLGDNLQFLPPAWFASLALGSSESMPPHLAAIGWIALAAAVVAAGAAFLIPAKELQIEHRMPHRGPVRRLVATLVAERERVTFDFALAMIPRSREGALRAGPVFAFPAGLLFVAAAIHDPSERRLFVHILLFVVNAYLPAAVLLLTRSEHGRARWVFDTSPISDEGSLRSGFWKATIVAIGLPMFAVMQIASFSVSGATAALHTGPVLIVTMGVLFHAVRSLPDPFPFGNENEGFEGGAGEGALALAFFLTLLAFAEFWIVRDGLTSAVATAVLGCVLFWMTRAWRPVSRGA
jgi:hypothetical protein